jgi:hypothetical protein
VVHVVADLLRHHDTALGSFGGVLHEGGDLFGQAPRILGELAHLLGDDGKALAGSPARAASIAALSASMLVWLAMREIAPAIWVICPLFCEIALTTSTIVPIWLIPSAAS